MRARTAAVVDDRWFSCSEPLPGVWQIAEPLHVYTWLVEGSDSAAMLDTGCGIRPIRPTAEAATSRPLQVLNTHSHFDHVGGNYEFDEIAIHALGVGALARTRDQRRLDGFIEFARERLRSNAWFQDVDARYYWLALRESMPAPLPTGYQWPGAYQIRPSSPSRTIGDGETIDLGGRVLTALHTPGHSPDSISFLDERKGILFAADTFNLGPVYCHLEGSDLGALVASARRLADVSTEVRYITTHHYPRVIAEPNLLREFATAMEMVGDGVAPISEGVSITGHAYREARFDHFSVSLPPV